MVKGGLIMSRTILVTGGAGFIGSNFVRYICDNYPGYNVIVLDALTYAGNMDNIPDSIKRDSRFTFWYGNIKNGELVNDLVSKSDIVVHFAAESHVARSIFDNTLFFETDVMGTQVVANAVLKHMNSVERFIHISTSEVYGTAIKVPMTEEHPLNPTTPYAAAKLGADRLVYSYYVTYSIPAVIIRPFNNYGPNQHLEKVIPRFITSAILNEPLTIHGSGEYTRDWNYVGDVCRALDQVLQINIDRVKGQVINIGTGKDISVLDIAGIVLEKMGKPMSLISYMGDRPGQVNRHLASTDKSWQLLGWKAETDFNNGINKTINWYQQNREWWQKQLWMRHVPIKTSDGRVEYH
jgi:dTDP-glucose 4,6-dehydratase